MVVSVFYNCINCFTSYIQKCLRHTEKVLDKIIRDEFLKKMNQETKFKDPQNENGFSELCKCFLWIKPLFFMDSGKSTARSWVIEVWVPSPTVNFGQIYLLSLNICFLIYKSWMIKFWPHKAVIEIKWDHLYNIFVFMKCFTL